MSYNLSKKKARKKKIEIKDVKEMKNKQKTIIGGLFWDICEFAKSCPLYSASSYTCNRGGGGFYCGKWRGIVKNGGVS